MSWTSELQGFLGLYFEGPQPREQVGGLKSRSVSPVPTTFSLRLAPSVAWRPLGIPVRVCTKVVLASTPNVFAGVCSFFSHLYSLPSAFRFFPCSFHVLF